MITMKNGMAIKVPQNVSSGRYAVALVGFRGWRRDSAIGDGITAATMALVTRTETQAEADRLAAELNDAQPGVLPGSPDVPRYEAGRYNKTDYIGQQNRDRGQTRDCDRRICDM